MRPEYDAVFVGGGLAATRLLLTLPERFERVAIIDPVPLPEGGVYWSYWSSGPTPYDPFVVGEWSWATTGDRPPQPLHPHTLRLVRSGEVLAGWLQKIDERRVERIRSRARAVERLSDHCYRVKTDDGDVRGRWVFDSACDVEPAFPAADMPRAFVSGVGLRVVADAPVFDPSTAVLFEPLDDHAFAYVLPLSTRDAVVESASFSSGETGDDAQPLHAYLARRFPGTRFTVEHHEYGVIPLGFAPRRTAGPRHVLLGTKRGLVKPSAGYGISAIAEDTERMVRQWQRGRFPSASRRAPLPWRLFDASFLRLAARDRRLVITLLDRVMSAVPLAHVLGFLSEEAGLQQLWPALRAAAPLMR